METTKARAWLMGFLYVGGSVLAALKTAADAGQPFDYKLLIDVLLIAFLAIGGYINRTVAMVPTNDQAALNRQTPELYVPPFDDVQDSVKK